MFHLSQQAGILCLSKIKKKKIQFDEQCEELRKKTELFEYQ